MTEAMTAAERLIAAAGSVVVVDWPSRDLPEALARAGIVVFVKGGPEPQAYSVWEVRDGQVVARPAGAPPERADLVYAHRPLAELPGLVALARSLGATAVWIQSGRAADGTRDPRGCWLAADQARAAHEIVESAGLVCVHDTYLADAIRRPDTGR